MDNIIGAINHAMDMARNRLQWYSVTNDSQHIIECMGWNEIASMYMRELNKENK